MRRIVSITEQIVRDIRAAETSGTTTASHKIPNCLIVEDDLMDAELTSRSLMLMGIDVTVAHSGQEALAFLEESKNPLRPKYDIIFIDLKLHGTMDGIEILKAVKRQFPAIHTVIVSGYLGNDDLQRFLSQGKDKIGYVGMVSKPLERMDVEEIIEKHKLNIKA